jgi:hypothetical protein
MSNSNFKNPYGLSLTGNRVCNFKRKEYFNAKGVYVIRCKESKKTLYVGSGNCVYRALYRHFAKWCEGERNVGRGYTYKDYFVDANLVECAIFKTTNYRELESSLISSLRPRDSRISGVKNKGTKNPSLNVDYFKSLFIPLPHYLLPYYDYTNYYKNLLTKAEVSWNKYFETYGEFPY